MATATRTRKKPTRIVTPTPGASPETEAMVLTPVAEVPLAREPAPELVAKPMSKQSQVVALLRRPEGASAQEIMEATGWQKHSVRGFISGTAKKSLGLAITTEKGAHGTVYKVPA